MIPQASPHLRFQRFRVEIEAAIAAVLDGEWTILGPKVEAFEAAFAAVIGARYCVGVNSGTDAIALALRALGVGPGDEVVTVALTAAGTCEAILHCGATPRFVDVSPTDWTIDPAAVEAAINHRTSAIVAVHLYGYPAPVVRLREIADRRGLILLEDCAQAHGPMVGAVNAGSIGHAAAFSFYPTKNLGALGDGGAVVTSDAAVASRVRALRNHGWETSDRISRSLGFNSRLDEVQAAILLVLLDNLAAGNAERRASAAYFLKRFEALPLQLPVTDPGAIFHQFAIVHPKRDGLAAVLREQFGVGTGVHYAPALHRHEAFAAYAPDPMPETERLERGLLSLPIQPEISTPFREQIAGAVEAALQHV